MFNRYAPWVRIEFPYTMPRSVRVATRAHWTGRVLGFPSMILRSSKDASALKRELDRPGVYVLVSTDGENGRQRVYVGRAEPGTVLGRLNDHLYDPEKKFWQETIAIVSSDDAMPIPAMALEARLIDLVKEEDIGYTSQNSQRLPSLSRMDEDDSLSFLRDALFCMRALGVREFGSDDDSDVDDPGDRQEPAPSDVEAPEGAELELRTTRPKVVAYGRDLDEGQFQVLPPSRAVKTLADGSPCNGQYDGNVSLVSEGVLVERDDGFEFVKPWTFADRVRAKAFILCNSGRGPGQWTGLP